MKLRISKHDHAAIVATSQELGIATNEVVRRCLRKHDAEGNHQAQTDRGETTVITISDQFQAWTAEELRNAIGWAMEARLATVGKRRPVECETAPAGTCVVDDEGNTITV